MVDSALIKKSWQQYDLTVSRAVPYAGDGWSGYDPPNNWPSDNPPEALWLFETGSMYLDEMNDNDWILFTEEDPITLDTTTKIEGVSSIKMFTYAVPVDYPDIRIQDAPVRITVFARIGLGGCAA